MAEPILMFVAAYVAAIHGMTVFFIAIGIGAKWVDRAEA